MLTWLSFFQALFNLVSGLFELFKRQQIQQQADENAAARQIQESQAAQQQLDDVAKQPNETRDQVLDDLKNGRF